MKCVDFTKTQKSRHLEKETLFFLQTKKPINYTLKATLLQKKQFCSGGNRQIVFFNPLLASAAFSYHQKTPENQSYPVF